MREGNGVDMLQVWSLDGSLEGRWCGIWFCCLWPVGLLLKMTRLASWSPIIEVIYFGVGSLGSSMERV